MAENKDWLEEWKKMMCAKTHSRSGVYWDDDIRCETPDGIVTCNECRYGDYKQPQTIETCSECDECLFSWYDSKWHCGDMPDDIGDGMILDNDIYTTVHENCPLKGGNE